MVFIITNQNIWAPMVVKPHSVGFKNTSRYMVPETTTLTAHRGINMLAYTAPKDI